MRSAHLLAAGLACLSILAFAGIRAADSAECAGAVVDENGVPVGAAQIRLEDGAGKVNEAETDGAGRFTIRNLSAGNYKMEVRKQGFFLLAGKELTLHAGPNEVNFTLNHAQELHEQVQVAAPANQIDPQDTAQRSTLTSQDIRDIPVPNTHVLRQSLVALPEIVQDNLTNLHVAGARSGETQYLLDGFEIGNPVNGALTSRFNADATRAAEVHTGRIGAAYAHSGAGLLNLETPDGDDRWRFGTTNPAPGINVQEGVHLGNWYPRFTSSGPIEKGRFWFSDSISVQHTFEVVKQQPAGANTFEEWAGDNLLRLQYNITPKHILHASFLYNRAHDTNLGLDALDPQSTTVTAEQRRAFGSLKDQIWLGNTLFELGVAADGGVLEYVPQGMQPFVVLTGGTSGNYFQHLHQRGRRVQAVGSLAAVSRHWHGTHQFAAGFNAAGLRYSQSAVRGVIQALRADATLVRQTTFAGPASPELSNTQAGGYAQDTWSISKHFILQAGLRTDWDRFTQSAMAEPRLSGNALPFGDDRAKLSLGWGIYNAPLNLSLIAQVYDQQQADTFYDPTGKAFPARRDFSPAGQPQGPLSLGQLFSAPGLLGKHRTVWRVYAVARAFRRGIEPGAGFHLLCAAAIRTRGLGCTEPAAFLGLDSNAYLGYPVELFLRVQDRVSLQRRQSPAATCRSAEFPSVSCLCGLESGTGEEIWIPRLSVGGANRSGQYYWPAKSGYRSEQHRRSQFWCLFRRPRASNNIAGTLRRQEVGV